MNTRIQLGLALTIVGCNVLVPGVILVLWMMDGYDREEAVALLQIALPALSWGCGLAVAHIFAVPEKGRRERTANKAKSETKKLNVAELLAVAFVATATTCAIAALILKAYNIGLKSFEDLKFALACGEASLGAATGAGIRMLLSRPGPEA